MKKIVLGIIILFSFQVISFAQQEPIKLLGHHTLSFEGGAKTNSNTAAVSTSLAGVDVKTGFVGFFSYGYWFDEEWSFNLSGGVFGAGVSTSFNNVETNAITPLLVGFKYYPTALALGARGRIFFGLAAGDYIGYATKTENIKTSVVTESSFGGQVSIGADIFPASWFRVGPKISYHMLGDYSKVIGTTKNLSGVAFSVEFGFIF